MGRCRAQILQLRVEPGQVDVLRRRNEDLVVLGAAHLVLLLVHHQLLIELLAGAQAHDLDLHVHARLVAVETDELFGQVDDLDRLAHIQNIDAAALGQGTGLQHQLGCLRDGHEIALDVGVRQGDGAALFDLRLEQRDDTAVAAQHIAEANCHALHVGVARKGLDATLPVIALMGGVIAGETAGYAESSFIAPLMYFIGIVAVLVAAIILKKTKPFSGKPAPFVMELPQYHIPQVKTVLLHVWERLKGFIIKAGTILFLACVVMWFLGGFGFTDGGFGMVEDSADSLMAAIGGVIAPIFAPLGFGEWQPVAASISGFTAKEAIVSTMGVLANVAGDTEDAVNVAAGVASWFPTGIAAFSFLMFNLLDSPCLAAIATMAKEMNDRKWFWFAILFQNIFAYVVCLCFYQIGSFVTGGAFGFGTVVGFVVLIVMLFLLFRPDPYKDQKVYSKRSVQA